MSKTQGNFNTRHFKSTKQLNYSINVNEKKIKVRVCSVERQLDINLNTGKVDERKKFL